MASADVLGATGYSRDGQAIGRIPLGLTRVVCAECGQINELVPPIDSQQPGRCVNTAAGQHRLRIAVVNPHG